MILMRSERAASSDIRYNRRGQGPSCASETYTDKRGQVREQIKKLLNSAS